jgi:Bacterial Ig-like domain (group 2)
MYRSCILLLIIAGLFLLFSSCGHEQQLVSIGIQPSTETFGASNIPVIGDTGLTVQLRALGNFIHPPVTKDITPQVTWASNSPQIVTVDANGVVTVTGQACGDALVSATVQTNRSSGNISSSGAIVTGTMTASVVCFTGGGTNLTVAFSGNGQGRVDSSPPGLSCTAPSPCTASFPANTSVTLTATPTPPSTFVGWTPASCTSTSQTCVVPIVSSTAVIANFQ